MKIISKHKDYYDSLQSHDSSTGVYERITRKVPVDWIGFANSTIGDESWKLATGLIGFCGKLFPYIQYDHTKPKCEDIHEIIYSLEDFELVRTSIRKVRWKRYTWSGMQDLMMNWNSVDNAKLWFNQDWSTIIDQTPKGWGGTGRTLNYVVPKDLFLQYKVPYFVLKYDGDNKKGDPKYSLILNPPLEDYKFYRIYDPYTAYQEIEMFLNNQIVRPDDPYIEPVPDKIKAESHGFDKFSFRKDKSPKK